MIQSLTLFTSTISFFHFLSTINLIPFFDLTLLMYQRLNSKCMILSLFSLVHLVSWKAHKIDVSPNQCSLFPYIFPVRMSIFYVTKRILLSWTNFFTYTRSRKCGNPYLFFTAFRRWYSDSYSFDIVLESYNVLLLGNNLAFTLLHI